MTHLLAFFTRIPARTYALTLTIALILTAIVSTIHWQRTTVRNAKQFVRDSIASAALSVAPSRRDTVYRTTFRTDTQWLRTQRTITRVDTLVRQVPESVLVAFPTVDSALRQCTTLARDCEQLRADLVTERVARERLQVTSDQIVVGARDSLRREQARPKRTTKSNVITAGVGAVVGAAITALTFFLQRH